MGRITVIGSGPAGISAALYAVRGGAEATVFKYGESALERADSIENYYGFTEPVSGRELYENGIKQARRLGVDIIEEEIVGLEYGSKLEAVTGENRYETDALIIATGSPRNVPPIEGIKTFEGRGVSYCAVCDGFFFKGKNTVVIGSGRYALHEAQTLLPVAGSVTVLTDGREPEVQFPETIKCDKRKISSIRGTSGDNAVVDGVVFEEDEDMETAGVFVAEGTAGSADLARKLGAAVEGNRIRTDETMATNVPGVFAAGDCTGGLLQVAAAVYEGAEAGLSALKYIKKQK